MKEQTINFNNFFEIRKLDEKTFSILSPFYFPNSSSIFPIKLIENEQKLVLTDNGGIIEYLDENNLEIDKEYTKNVLKKYKISIKNFAFYVETTPETLELDLANFIQAITLISQNIIQK